MLTTTAVTATPAAFDWLDQDGFLHHATTPGPFTIRDLDDEALATQAKRHRRAREDGLPVPRSVTDTIRTEQLIRFCLRMRYGAIDNHLGTHSYGRWYRLDEPPSYALAMQMDHTRWRLGQRHILTWAPRRSTPATTDT